MAVARQDLRQYSGSMTFGVPGGREHMIVEYIRYNIDAGRRDGFIADYAAASTALDESPHALAWELSACVDDPTQFILRIEWDSAEGHMQGFRQSPGFRPFFGHIRPYFNDILEMRHYEVTPVVNKRA
jgi:heme-degrading monooxygenase HmoA